MATGRDVGPAPPTSSSQPQSVVSDPLAIRNAERMRIADQLHDTTCQLLALLQLNFGRIRRLHGEEREALIVECERMVTTIGRQLRDVVDKDS